MAEEPGVHLPISKINSHVNNKSSFEEAEIDSQKKKS